MYIDQSIVMQWHSISVISLIVEYKLSREACDYDVQIIFVMFV